MFKHCFFSQPCLCVSVNLKHQHPSSCRPHHCSLSVLLSGLVFMSWPLANSECHISTVTNPCSPSQLKPCPHSISSLHVFAPRYILVIFSVVCFGSSPVSHHGHLMAGCSLAHQCCFSYWQNLAPLLLLLNTKKKLKQPTAKPF